MASLINKSAVRELALATAQARFKNIPGYSKERVSAAFLNRMESEFRNLVVRAVNNEPSSGGKTL